MQRQSSSMFMKSEPPSLARISLAEWICMRRSCIVCFGVMNRFKGVYKPLIVSVEFSHRHASNICTGTQKKTKMQKGLMNSQLIILKAEFVQCFIIVTCKQLFVVTPPVSVRYACCSDFLGRQKKPKNRKGVFEGHAHGFFLFQ
jgi:hypothetical protein